MEDRDDREGKDTMPQHDTSTAVWIDETCLLREAYALTQLHLNRSELRQALTPLVASGRVEARYGAHDIEYRFLDRTQERH